MLALLSLIAVGFLLGMRHATDADHVLAISTIVSRERSLRRAAAIGALWGLGHGVTVFVVGGLIILFGVVIPARVGLAMEFAVGAMLVLLGLFTLAGMAKQAREAGHAEDAHGHREHSTPQAWLDRHVGRFEPYQIARPLVVGVVHGLAGSAAVALLVLAAIRDPVWGLAYLVVFGAGTIAGMMLVTMALALPLTVATTRLPLVSHGVRVAAGVLSLGFGLLLMNRIAGVDGLFSAASR